MRRARRAHAPARRRPCTPAAAYFSWDGADAADYEGEDFYTLLGVPPSADAKGIKRAYYSLMRDCHPDLSDGDDESTEFCALLNEVYETLTDPDKRELYDSLAGFSASSVNPFMDTSGAFPPDKVFVDEYTCIGCRNCTNVACKTFAMEEEYGRARAMHQGVDDDEKLQTAIDSCPVNCIHWVTAPQLSLLEAAMAKMERVQVWALMSGGGSGRDVFTEASTAWEKRQAAVRARTQARQEASAWGQFWRGAVEPSMGSRMYEQAAAASGAASASGSYDDGDAAAGGGKDGGRIANLAARAARASRVWKSMQQLQRSRSRGLMLATSGVGDEGSDR